ncbi:septum formation initiator family protein [bacterium]|uniref:FtsB family cell division protein n=1 Tax=Gemmiger sp. TaxID=2049027 RepID=UPI002A8105E3|nr:septum formation initiator family protein [Gemmiger sp.]MCI5555492.1 septum formation initiator family protein [bacterium]MCI6082599.1 septum formation initiator family protein [bacterium]MCI6176186.1 septum formation initiator family protein [bacterium]MCI6248833.1 septum formation initiator family protein [bacterium]MCI6521122.1 septum formation initiator family protein [bacterium]
MNHRKHYTRRLIPVVVVLLFCWLFFSLIQCQITISSKRQELAGVQEQLSVQLAKNEELSRSLDDGEDAIIERIARDEGYAKPNERIWVDLSGK